MGDLAAVFRISVYRIFKSALNGFGKYRIELVDAAQHMGHHHSDGQHICRESSGHHFQGSSPMSSIHYGVSLRDENNSRVLIGRPQKPWLALNVMVTCRARTTGVTVPHGFACRGSQLRSLSHSIEKSSVSESPDSMAARTFRCQRPMRPNECNRTTSCASPTRGPFHRHVPVIRKERT